MIRSIGTETRRKAALAGTALAAMLLLTAAPAPAAVYPAGGSSFSGGAEGWQVTDASCDAEPVCTASGGYDGGSGNPPGSIAASTSVALNLVTLFESSVTLQSPDFTVADGRLGTLHLERQFDPGNLVDPAATTAYEVMLIDRTADRESVPLEETVGGSSSFVGKDAAVTVVPGHNYAISITVDTSSSVVGTGFLGGTVSTRFDNVGLAIPGGDGAGASGNGAGALSSQRLLATIQDSLVAPVTLRGKRLFVKARCPAAVGRSCRVALQGLLGRRSAATSRRVVRISPGRSKRIVLKVKPKARRKVLPRKRLLFKQTVKAGPATATVYRRLKLIRR